MSLFRKWLYGKAAREAGQLLSVLTRRASIPAAVCERGATRPESHFLNNPPGGGSFCGRLCRSSVEDRCGDSPSSLRVLRQNSSPRHAQVFKTLCLVSSNFDSPD